MSQLTIHPAGQGGSGPFLQGPTKYLLSHHILLIFIFYQKSHTIPQARSRLFAQANGPICPPMSEIVKIMSVLSDELARDQPGHPRRINGNYVTT